MPLDRLALSSPITDSGEASSSASPTDPFQGSTPGPGSRGMTRSRGRRPVTVPTVRFISSGGYFLSAGTTRPKYRSPDHTLGVQTA